MHRNNCLFALVAIFIAISIFLPLNDAGEDVVKGLDRNLARRCIISTKGSKKMWVGGHQVLIDKNADPFMKGRVSQIFKAYAPALKGCVAVKMRVFKQEFDAMRQLKHKLTESMSDAEFVKARQKAHFIILIGKYPKKTEPVLLELGCWSLNRWRKDTSEKYVRLHKKTIIIPFLMQVLTAMKQIHKFGISHNDLHGGNLLFFDDNDKTYVERVYPPANDLIHRWTMHLKLIDFGRASLIKNVPDDYLKNEARHLPFEMQNDMVHFKNVLRKLTAIIPEKDHPHVTCLITAFKLIPKAIDKSEHSKKPFFPTEVHLKRFFCLCEKDLEKQGKNTATRRLETSFPKCRKVIDKAWMHGIQTVDFDFKKMQTTDWWFVRHGFDNFNGTEVIWETLRSVYAELNKNNSTVVPTVVPTVEPTK